MALVVEGAVLVTVVGADVVGADVVGTDVVGADVVGADVAGADVAGADDVTSGVLEGGATGPEVELVGGCSAVVGLGAWAGLLRYKPGVWPKAPNHVPKVFFSDTPIVE